MQSDSFVLITECSTLGYVMASVRYVSSAFGQCRDLQFLSLYYVKKEFLFQKEGSVGEITVVFKQTQHKPVKSIALSHTGAPAIKLLSDYLTP